MNVDKVDKTVLTQPWRQKLYDVIFEADTPAGKAFDVGLIVAILLSVLVIMLDSVASIHVRYGNILYVSQWIFTGLFTVEYVLRLICAGRPWRYATSFFGVIDFLSVIPMYLSVFFPGSRYFVAIRLLRVLRVFRVLKLMRYISEAQELMDAIHASRRKIAVFLFVVVVLVVILGSVMYAIEGVESGFTSIPRSIYWAIVTLTTVGYGDISPQTVLGQSLAAVIMIIGFSIIVVPTGLVTVEFSRAGKKKDSSEKTCPDCGAKGHDSDAKHCKHCGARL